MISPNLLARHSWITCQLGDHGTPDAVGRRSDQATPPFRCLSEGNPGLRQAFQAAHGGVVASALRACLAACSTESILMVRSARELLRNYEKCSNLMMGFPVSTSCGSCQGTLPDHGLRNTDGNCWEYQTYLCLYLYLHFIICLLVCLVLFVLVWLFGYVIISLCYSLFIYT